MGRRPSPQHSLERVNNNKGYSPANCRWATKADQARNRRSTRLTLEKVADIRSLAKAGMYHREIAAVFKVSRVTVTEVLMGRTWKS